MYESQTTEVILKRMLDNVPSDVDKREGSIVYDATAPVAIETEILYATIDYFLKNTFGDTADRMWLIERAKERGLTPYEATFSIAKGIFKPDTLEVPIGFRLSYDDINFKVTEKLSAGIYLLECETAGKAGNVPAGRLIPNTYLNNLESAWISEITVPGEDEEDTEEFRERYLASFNSMAYGGNIADYKEKVKKIGGIGGVKVYPVWNGGGTVRIVFMTSEYKVPTAEFIDRVQTAIDPVPNNGLGVGIAPIGHTVTVQGVSNSDIAISFRITCNGDISSYKSQIEAVIDDYFTELNEQWEDTKVDTTTESYNNGITVRVSQLESRILDISGIVDVEGTTLNGVAANLVLGVDEIAVRGSITWL